jgi:phosphoglycerol transferase MdoB-like AlkP superfamily enzyme
VAAETAAVDPDRAARGPAWTSLARVLAAPAVFAALDLAVRLAQARLLELDHAPTWGAAWLAALLGVAKDLLLVLPAFALFALVPRAATRRLAHVVLALAVLILAGDLVYFYLTLEHVEPILFVNVNLLSVGGVVDARGVSAAAFATALVGALVWLNARLLRGARAGLARPLGALALLAVCALPLLPLAIATEPQMPKQTQVIEEFLDRTRNASLKKVAAPILADVFRAAAAARHFEKGAPPLAPLAYADDEAALLRELRLLDADAPGPQVAPPAAPEIRRIVVVILESLAYAYLHSQNPATPAEATPFLDSLLARYPHFERFYTSNMPSDWGLSSLLVSRLQPDWDGGRPSLLSVLRDEAGFESFYVRAVSKHYSNELFTYTRMFRMDHYIAYEELAERYDSKWHSAWGFNDAVVYEEGVRILNAHRDDKVVVVLNTIDLHQPTPFQGIPFKYLPDALKQRNVPLYNALLWTDRCVQGLFETLEQEKLFDEHTLVVVTSDHTPHPGVEFRAAVPPEEYVRLGRLPLIFAMRDPARLRGLDTERLASQVDLSPTVLELVGVAKPRGMVGRSLFGVDASRVALGFYRDTFYYRSPASSFEETFAGEPSSELRNRALRKWMHNLDVELR